MSCKGYTPLSCEGVRWLVRKDIHPSVKEQLLPTLSSSSFFKKSRAIKEGARKSLWEFSVSGDGGDEGYLIKRYQSKGVISRLKTLFISSKAARELKAARAIELQGIPTTPPVAMGERRRWGCITESLVVLKKLQECRDLNQYFLKEYPALTLHQDLLEKRMIIEEFGRFARNVHQAGILQTDFSLNNFLLTRDARGKPQLYLSDFEKVTIRHRLSFDQKVKCLAKLDRVGREISAPDRWRFLKSYQGGEDRKGIKSFARTVYERTLSLLKQDMARGRITNVYTDALYERYEEQGIKGYYRKEYKLEDILDIIHRFDLLAKSLPSADAKHREELQLELAHGSKMQLLTVMRYINHPGSTSASALWTKMCILFMAGIPIDLPHVVMEVEVKDNREGYLFIPKQEHEVSLGAFLRPPLAKEELLLVLDLLSKLMKKLHHFGTFGDGISESDFVVVKRGIGTPSLYLNNVERFTVKKEVLLSEKKRELSLLNALIKKHYPTMTFDLAQRYFKTGDREQKIIMNDE